MFFSGMAEIVLCSRIYLGGRTVQGAFSIPGWQIMVGCFVRGVKKWNGTFYPGMFGLAFNVALCGILSCSGSFTVSKNTHLRVNSTERARKVLIW